MYLDGNTEQRKGLTVGSIELKAGQAPHPPPAHREEEILFVSEGHGEIAIGAKVTEVGHGAVLCVSANHVHGNANTSKVPRDVLLFQVAWQGAVAGRRPTRALTCRWHSSRPDTATDP